MREKYDYLLIEEVTKQMKTDEPSINLRNLRDVNKIFNCDCKYYVRNYTSTNRLLKVAEWVVARKLGFKAKVARPQKLRRTTRIKDKINLLRRDFSRLDWWSKRVLSGNNKGTAGK